MNRKTLFLSLITAFIFLFQVSAGAAPPSRLPQVSIDSPYSGSVYTTAQTVTVTASASEKGKNSITKVELYEDGTLKATNTSDVVTYYWVVTSGDNGTHTWTAKAYDDGGQSATSTSVNVTVNVSAADTTPNPFTFTDVTGAALSTVVTSNAITVSGINAASPISISGGTYSVNGGGYTSGSSTVTNGSTVTVRVTSSSNYSSTVNATLTIGGVSDTFSVTTQAQAADTTPNPFTFTDVTGAAPSTVVTSNAITVSGINAASPISISGGTYSVNGGGYTSGSGTVTNGSTVTVRVTSSSSYSSTVNATLTIGGVSDTFSVTTQASVGCGATAPAVPSNLTATAVSSSQINLTWQDTACETSYQLYRLQAGGVWVNAATLGQNTTSYSNTGLSASTTYSYIVRAVNSYGASAWSNIPSATTLSGSGTTTPPTVTTGSASGTTASAATLSGTVDPNGASTTAYFQYGMTTAYGSNTASQSIGSGTTAVSIPGGTISGLSCSTTYHYRAVGANAGGTTHGSDKTLTTSSCPVTLPTVTTGSATGISATAATLSGTVDPNGASTTAYFQYGTTTAYGSNTASQGVGSGSSAVNITANISGLNGNTTYHFRLIATNTGGTAYGPDKTFTTASPPPPPSSGGETLWADQFGGAQNDSGYTVAVDGSGNIIVVGVITGTADLGGGLVSSTGAADMFVAKYSPSGSYLWAKHFGGSGSITPQKVTVDSNGNAVVTGYFSGTVNLGGGSVTSVYNTNDIFVAKYSSSGTYQWSKIIGSTGNDIGYSIALDSVGNVVVAGTFQGYVDFGGGTLIGYGNSNVFVAKYSSGGAYLWALGLGNGTTDAAYGVAVDQSNNILVTGYFAGTLDFGGGQLSTAGQSDVFLAKYTASGAFLWAKGFGNNTGATGGYAIAVDGNSNVIVTGSFSGTVDFGGQVLSSTASQDMFLAEYSPSGSLLWAKRAGSTNSNCGRSVAVDNSNNVLVTGQYYSPTNFGSGLISGGGSFDIFVAKYSASGANIWSEGFGGPYTDSGMGIAVDTGGNAIATGSFYGTADFGGVTLTSAWNDIFLVKLAP